MDAHYGEEISNLKISRIVGEFLFKHVRNLLKRIFYNYYLRDLSLASIELPLGILLLTFGVGFGGWHWLFAVREGIATPIGTVMLSALPTLMGMQLVLAFLAYDIASVPKRSLHRKLGSIFGADKIGK
jgi:dolichol-phosphate mannosyltransferase